MRYKIVQMSNLTLHFQLEKAEREVARREAQLERLRVQKNNATEALHGALGRVQRLKAEESKRP